MTLYFTNCSKQIRNMIDTDYVEDVYDEILSFFETNRILPHFIKVIYDEGIASLSFNHTGESFIIKEIDEENLQELKEMLNDIEKDLFH